MSYATAVLADSPVAYWKLNETSGVFADSSGNSHNATYNSGTRGSLALTADSGAASVLGNGTAYLANLAFTSAIPQTPPFTVECLVRFTGLGSNEFFVTQGGGSTGWGVGVNTSSQMDYREYSSSGAAVGSALSTGVTYHLAWVATTGTITYYLNGVLIASQTPGSHAASTHAFTMGADGTGGDPLSGYLSDVAIYSTALPAGHVNNHYQASLTAAVAMPIQTGTGNNATTVTLPTPSTTGNTLVVGIQTYGQSGGSDIGDITAVSDGTNTFARITGTDQTKATSFYGMRTVFYVATGITGQSTETVTITYSEPLYNALSMWEVTPSTVDQSCKGSGSISNVADGIHPGTLTPSANNAVGVMLVSENCDAPTNYSPDTGWVTLQNGTGGNAMTFSGTYRQSTAAALVFAITGGAGTVHDWCADGLVLIPPAPPTPVAVVPVAAAATQATAAVTASALTTPSAANQTQAVALVTAATAFVPVAAAATQATATVTFGTTPVALAPAAVVATQALATVVAGTAVRQLGSLIVTIAWHARLQAIVHTRQLGSPSVTNPSIHATSITHARAQGNPTLSARVLPSGLAHTRAQGSPNVAKFTLLPGGLTRTSTLAALLPADTLFPADTLDPSGSTRTLGPPTVVDRAIHPSGLARTRNQGSLTVIGRDIRPIGIGHVRAQGTPTLSGRVQPASLIHTRTLGAPEINLLILHPAAISRA